MPWRRRRPLCSRYRVTLTPTREVHSTVATPSKCMCRIRSNYACMYITVIRIRVSIAQHHAARNIEGSYTDIIMISTLELRVRLA